MGRVKAFSYGPSKNLTLRVEIFDCRPSENLCIQSANTSWWHLTVFYLWTAAAVNWCCKTSLIQLISVSTECASQFPDSRTTKTERFLHLKDFLKKTKITYSRTDEKKVPYTSMDRKIPKPEVRVQIWRRRDGTSDFAPDQQVRNTCSTSSSEELRENINHNIGEKNDPSLS